MTTQDRAGPSALARSIAEYCRVDPEGAEEYISEELSPLLADLARLRDALESVELRAHFEAKGKDGSWADVMRWARSALAGCTCDSRTFGGPLCSTHPLPRP